MGSWLLHNSRAAVSRALATSEIVLQCAVLYVPRKVSTNCRYFVMLPKVSQHDAFHLTRAGLGSCRNRNQKWVNSACILSSYLDSSRQLFDFKLRTSHILRPISFSCSSIVFGVGSAALAIRCLPGTQGLRDGQKAGCKLLSRSTASCIVLSDQKSRQAMMGQRCLVFGVDRLRANMHGTSGASNDGPV
jgi:hypothetical protein